MYVVMKRENANTDLPPIRVQGFLSVKKIVEGSLCFCFDKA